MSIDLPHKLLCKILLDAAQASTSSCRALCEVSTWVRHLALPLLYTTIPIHAIESITTMRPICPPTAFAPVGAVRNILATDSNSNSFQWLNVAQHCTRISHLAVSHDNLLSISHIMQSTDAYTNLETDLHVLMFQTKYGSIFFRNPGDKQYDDIAQSHIFLCITHLHLEDPIDPDLVMHIGTMSRLTHLAVSCGDANGRELRQIFRVVAKTSVEVFVLVLSLDHTTVDHCAEVERWVYRMREKGKNIVYVVRPQFEDLEREWDAVMRGGATIWERAVEETQELMDRMRFRTKLTMSINLPLELLHHILLYAAESSSSSCRALCKVSTWTRRLALPLLYTTVTLGHTTPLCKFMDLMAMGWEAVRCPLTPVFCPADTVRSLCVPIDSWMFEPIMRHCSNVTHLAIHQSNLMRLVDATVPKPRTAQERWRGRHAKTHEGTCDLQILLLANYKDLDRSLSSDRFQRITHLRLEDPVLLGAGVSWLSVESQLECMPRLTHFAAPWQETTEVGHQTIFDVLASTSIEVFVLVLMYQYLDKRERRSVEDWVCKSRKTESRIYTVPAMYSEAQMEWEAEVRGGTTVWERAADYTWLLMSRT